MSDTHVHTSSTASGLVALAAVSFVCSPFLAIIAGLAWRGFKYGAGW